MEKSGLTTVAALTRYALRENLSPADIQRRYFHGRRDDLHAFDQVFFACADIA